MNGYAIHVHQATDHFYSNCPAIPEAHSAGDTVEELLENAVEGLVLAMSIYVDRGAPIPSPTPAEPGQRVVELPVLAAAKAALWNALCARGWRVADLARALGLSRTAAARLVDLAHSSRIEHVERALLVLGARLSVQVERAA